MKRFIRSLSFAMSGIYTAAKEQRNLQIHFSVLTLVIAAGLVFGITLTEWISVFLAASIVVTAEMINSAIEKTVDLASPDIHPLAKEAKDIAAGAVLISVTFAVVIGIFIFGQYLLQIISDYL